MRLAQHGFPRVALFVRREGGGTLHGRIRRLAPLTAAVAVLFALLPPPAAYASHMFPGQFVAKQYTEWLGRLPDQSGWQYQRDFFWSNHCSQASLKASGQTIFLSSEFNNLAYPNAAKVLVAYRAVLNREPDSGGYDFWLSYLNGGGSWATFVNGLYDGAEFANLVPAICHGTNTSYNFGTGAAIDIPTSGSGFTGTQTQLQSLLNSTASGGTVNIAQRAVVRLTSTLTVPAGVTLKTTGTLPATKYAQMGRLVSGSTFNATMVQLQPGAKLQRIWVDGQRGLPSNKQANAINVTARGGTGTNISNTKLSNTRGVTSLLALGSHEGLPCGSTTITSNVVTSYSSSHSNNQWADGITVSCENATVTTNQVVDATDVSIILFRSTPAVQKSLVENNTILSAGLSAFGGLALETHVVGAPADGPGQASHNFTGTRMRNNTLWTSDRTHFDIGISVGIRPWSGFDSQNGTGASVTNNTAGSQFLRADSGVVVAGMLNATVTGNNLNTWLANTVQCPTLAVGASVNDGYASGTIQSYTDALYMACLIHN